MVDCFQIFIISRSIEILIVLNFWLGVHTYVKHAKQMQNNQNVTLHFFLYRQSRYYGRRGKSSSLEIELSDNEEKNVGNGPKVPTTSTSA